MVGTGGSSLAQWFVAGWLCPEEHLAMPGDIFGVMGRDGVATTSNR